MDIGKLFKDAWNLYRADLGPLIVGSIVIAVIFGVVGVLAVLPVIGSLTDIEATTVNGTSTVNIGDVNWGLFAFGIGALLVLSILLAPALYAGLYSMVLRRVREGRAAEYGDIFSGFRSYGRVTVAGILLGLFTALGYLFFFFPGIYLSVIWVYAFILVVDRGTGWSTAMGDSNRMVKGDGWWTTFAALLVGYVVYAAASMVLGFIPVIGGIIGLLLTPFIMTYTVAMYFQAQGQGQQVDEGIAGRGAGTAGVATLPPAPDAPPVPPAPGYAPAPPPSGYEPAAPPPPAAASAPDAEAWRAAADPLAAAPPAGAPAPPEEARTSPQAHVHQVADQADEPGVDAATGRLEKHCSQCGTLIEGSHEFCGVCALEMSGGDVAEAETGAAAGDAEPEAPPPPQPPSQPGA